MEQMAVAVKIRHPSRGYHEAQITHHLGKIPPRSRLYGLEPCEVGTIWGECLTSYLNRLGWRHGVSPRDLVAQEILPSLNKRISRSQLAVFSWSSAMSINGNGNLAREWATTLEELTTRSDLHLLTLSSWVGDLQTRRFLREKPAWCPACYAEWKEQERPLYEPFVWMLQTITLCIEHKRTLEDHCPHCQKHQSFIKADTLPGYCTRCNIWLGSAFASEVKQEINEAAVLEWQQWVICSLEELQSASMSSGAHGMRNEMHLWLKCLHRLIQCSRFSGKGARNTSDFYKSERHEVCSQVTVLMSYISLRIPWDSGITSLPTSLATPKRLLALVRDQWRIENGLHSRRDRPLDEDRSQLRLGHAPHLLALLNNVTIGLLANLGEDNQPRAQRTFDKALALLAA
jgi:hypothetical protein